MQNKTQVPSVGLWPLFQADVLQFTTTWPEKITVHKAALEALVHVAVEPAWLVRRSTIVTAQQFAALYAAAPDFVLALLQLVRLKWRKLGKSNSGQIQKFLACNVSMKPLEHQRAKSQWQLYDSEIATAYELQFKKSVEVDDVTKARKALAKRIARGRKLAAKCFPQGGNNSRKPSV